MLMLIKYTRFLFPDSPTKAWFLTEEERVIAIRRIKVSSSECSPQGIHRGLG